MSQPIPENHSFKLSGKFNVEIPKFDAAILMQTAVGTGALLTISHMVPPSALPPTKPGMYLLWAACSALSFVLAVFSKRRQLLWLPTVFAALVGAVRWILMEALEEGILLLAIVSLALILMYACNASPGQAGLHPANPEPAADPKVL